MKTLLEWLEAYEDHWLVELIGGLCFFASILGLCFLLFFVYPDSVYY